MGVDAGLPETEISLHSHLQNFVTFVHFVVPTVFHWSLGSFWFHSRLTLMSPFRNCLRSAANIVIALGLADGPINGNLYVMKTTIDNAGRLVIPKDIRRESGIKPGMQLEVRWEKGAIAITPAPLAVKLERKGRLLVAVPSKDTPRLSMDTVERTRKALRKERLGDST